MLNEEYNDKVTYITIPQAEKYLNKLFGNANVSSTEWHTILQKVEFPSAKFKYKNKEGGIDVVTKYSKNVFLRMLEKPMPKHLENLYNSINYLIYKDDIDEFEKSRQKNLPQTNPDEVFHDESNMEYCNQQLLNKYQFEGKKRLVKITESQLQRLINTLS